VRQTGRRTTIADVAKAASVSKAAVSFAFNAPERLNAETASRIRAIAAELHYRPDPVARMLAARRTETIGILTPQALDVVFPNPYFGSFTAGVAAAAESAGYSLQFISPVRGSLIRAVHQATVDGFIAYGLSADHPEIDQVRRSGIPFVLVDSTALPEELSVSVDDEIGARSAAEYLIELGHRSFAILAFEPPLDATSDLAPAVGNAGGGAGHGSAARYWTTADDAAARRMRGYVAALDGAGIDVPPGAIASMPSTLEAGATAFRRLYDDGQRPTAVLAMSDALAIGVIRAARDLGIHVPRDVSVVGFDDIDVAAFTDPPLTTIHQPGRSKGEAAMRILLSRLEGGDAHDSPHWRLETRLIVRGSTGPAAINRQEVASTES
jgi:DNA-binding LacI/PurR family transcriptional regulator